MVEGRRDIWQIHVYPTELLGQPLILLYTGNANGFRTSNGLHGRSSSVAAPCTEAAASFQVAAVGSLLQSSFCKNRNHSAVLHSLIDKF